MQGHLEEINEILNTDVMITIVQEEPQNKNQDSALNKELIEKHFPVESIWWIRFFKKRKYCLMFFMIIFIAVIILAIAIPLSI